MLNANFAKFGKTFYLEIFGGKDWTYFWEARFLPRWLPLLAGVLLGMASAVLIYNQTWHYLIPLVLVVPAAIIFNRYPFVAIILWLLLTHLFVLTPTQVERFIYWILYRALPPMALLIVLLASWFKVRKITARLGRADLAVFIFLLASVANLLVLTEGNIKAELIRYYDKLFIPLCMYWLIRLLAPDKEDIQRLIPVAFVTVLTQIIIGLMQWFIPQFLPEHWTDLAGIRTTGTVGNPAVYTSLLVLCMVILLQYAMTTQSKGKRFMSLLVISLAAACVFFSFSRGSWLGGLVILTALMFVYTKTILRLALIVFTILIILGNGLLAAQMAHAWERLHSDTSDSRIVQNYGAIRMIKLKPFFGWGWANYNRYDSEYYTRVGDEVAIITKDQTLHNTALFFIAEFGFIIFFFYLFPFAWWFWLSLKAWPRLPRTGFWSWPLLTMFWLVIIHITIVGNFMPMYQQSFGMTIWWMSLGFAGNIVDQTLDEPGDVGYYSPELEPVLLS